MVLDKEVKKVLFDIMQNVVNKDDVSYIRMLLDLRVKEIDALAPKGMDNKPRGFFG